ncbi:hypothetical protein [Streptomyces sp. H27-C3]|uniref:hypothetical protein n=1 Tax=Streptomyces sp. H27-C3 TaxID=3046305 RepID=UPI0024BA618F|nr:hypothetical protein [Streptomyces sp. H27-C3]MDJ0467142.1 hypothetical protein [Streptomyces sp. H27-C3]
MTSVMGLLEEREMAARVRAEELRAQVERIAAELGEAEAVLGRRVIARAELAEALAAGAEETDVLVPGPRKVPTAVEKVPVTGSTVPRRRQGLTLQALAPDYRRLVELVESGPGGGDGVSAKDLAVELGLELVPAKIEGVRSRAKRLVEREWLAASPSGRFTPRQPTATAPAAVGQPGGGRGGGS